MQITKVIVIYDINHLKNSVLFCFKWIKNIISNNIYCFRAEKSEILNHDELQTADLKIEYFRTALSAITKKLAPASPSSDVDKLMVCKLMLHRSNL